MKDKLYVIKIGGKLIDDTSELNAFLKDFAKLNVKKILVHGGGKAATKISHQLHISVQMIAGRRITNTESLEVVTMVYSGLISKTITAKLQAQHCNAMGLSGADGNSILAAKRPVYPVDYGWVGDIKRINTPLIDTLLQQHITPVYCAITHDGHGQLLNTNADTIAAEIAIAMCHNYTTALIYCFEKQGVLADINDQNSVIPSINTKTYNDLKNKGIIDQGMLPKMENGFYALNHKVANVIIGNREVIGSKRNRHTTLKL